MASILEESKKARKVRFLGLRFNKKIIIGIIILAAIAGGVYFYYFRKTDTFTSVAQAKEWTVKKGDIQIGLDSTGKVVAEDGVDLSFSVSGDDALEVEKMYVKEGDKIKKGDKVASVKTESLEINVKTAYANYKSALETYNEKIEGATKNDIDKQKAAIEQAKISLDQAKISLEKTKVSAVNSIESANQAADDAKKKLDDNSTELTSDDVSKAYDSLVNTVKSTLIAMDGLLPGSDKIIGVDNTAINDDFEQNLGAKDPTTLISAQGTYTNAKAEIAKLNTLVLGLNDSSSFSEIDKAAQEAKTVLEKMEDHQYRMQQLIDATIVSSDLTQTTLDGFKTTINTNRSSVNSKILALDNAIDAIKTAKDGLDDYVTTYNNALKDIETAKKNSDQDIATAESTVKNRQLSLEDAQRTYNDLIAPLTDAELASARSQLTSASTNLEKAQLELSKATLTSPIDGEVVQLNYKAGDIIIDPTDPVAVILNTDTLYIELSVEESDINKLKIGQKAKATFDAAEGVELEGEVSFISLRSSTDNNGIVTYPVRVVINNSDKAKIREGMTASLNFVTSGVSNVLIAPIAAVKNVNGKPSVQKDGGDWAAVTTGFTDGSSVEIITGLNEGDKLIYY